MPEDKIDPNETLQFKLFPKFAEYILKNKLRDFIKGQLKLMIEVDFPILKYYDLSIYTEEQLIDLSIPSYTDFLNAAIDNKLSKHLDEVIKRWEANQLPHITKDQ